MLEIKDKIVGQSVNKNSEEKLLPGEKKLTKEESDQFEKFLRGEKVESKKIKRPRKLPGETFKLKSNDEHALYLTINNIEIAGKIYPFEIFFNTKNSVHMMWTNALTVTISTLFRQAITQEINLVNVIENLKEVFDPNGGYWQQNVDKPSYMNSIVAEVAYCIEENLQEISKKNLDNEEEGEIIFKETKVCPKCGSHSLVKEAGCDVCKSCDYSKCS